MNTVNMLPATGDPGPCPHCGGQPVVIREGQGQAAPTCPVCGRDLPSIRIIRDSNFYGNAELLRQRGIDRGE
jgi:hypothetical protein